MYYYDLMNNLPESNSLKNMLFNSHPIADTIKASSIFKYLKLYEEYDCNIIKDSHFKTWLLQ